MESVALSFGIWFCVSLGDEAFAWTPVIFTTSNLSNSGKVAVAKIADDLHGHFARLSARDRLRKFLALAKRLYSR
jgi:hypothetical protein